MDERMAAVIEDCRLRLARGESIEHCLAAHPDDAEELRAMLPLVAQLQLLRQEPEPTYAHAARQRFLTRLAEAQASERPAGVRAMAVGWLRRLAVPAGAAAILIASGAGLVTASAEALPGQPLYPVQQVQEQVAGYLARTPEQQAFHHLAIANQRLRQLQKARAAGAPPLVIDDLTASMVQQTTLATEAVIQVPPVQRQQLATRLDPFLAAEDGVLQREEATAPPRVAADAARRRQQLAADRARLHAEAPGAASRATVVVQPSATSAVPHASPTPPADQKAAVTERPAASTPSTALKRSADPAAALPRPHPSASPLPTARSAAPHGLTPAQRLRRVFRLHQLHQATPQPVHTAQP